MGKASGRSGGGGGNRNGGNAPSTKNRGNNQRSTAWTSTAPVASEIFLKYYKAQNLVPEEEWDQFLHALQQPLPTTFRLTSCRDVAPRLNQQIEETFVPFLTGIEHEGVPLEAPKKLSWYPGGFAWQLNIPRQAIRKQDAFKKFQHFLVHEADCGNLSRQEAVSMIPPLLLDVQPHHRVLDMCAAPGSKTVQLLEALIGSDKDAVDKSAGLLIANDSDAKRCHLLVHQSLHRVPGTGMMVTNHDATQLPGLRLPTSDTNSNKGKFIGDDKEEDEEADAEGGATTKRQRKYEPLLFDRILADVPCSGDGTLRKNLGIWREFNPGNGTGLHSLQLRILLRGIALLKPGGRLVYSTCSMNPIENEAVLSAALSLCPEMSILDVSSSLPELKRRPGMTDWVVLDSQGNPPRHPDEPVPTPAPAPAPAPEPTTTTERQGAPRNGKKTKEKVWSKTLWPSGKEKELGLEKALRIYGHLQDTGAFFVCVLVKDTNEVTETEKGGVETTKRTADDVEVAPEAKKAKSEPEEQAEAIFEEATVEEEVDVSTLPAEVVGANVFSTKTRDFKEEPFIYLNPEDEQVKIFSDFFDLSPSFPRENLLVRNAAGAPLRSIYFTSSSTRSLLLSNSFTRMRLISCGVKIFTRQDSTRNGTYTCKWRVNSEGLEVLRPYMGRKRIVVASVGMLKRLMRSLTVAFEELDEVAFKERVAEMDPGSCVLEVDAKGEGLLFEQKLSLPFWRSKNTVNLMVEKVEKSALSLRLFGEDVTPHKVGPKARDLAKAEGEAKTAIEADEAAPAMADAAVPLDVEAAAAAAEEA
ncbi:BQ2448_2392 [Microbotryum intermedium]|uniref:BQ2448_2392 protein n=1 Tax=Microbotryum intermedium TaxID=269621 RepID=A0A238F621_9BASI|nr:BQ2448_2392 [Microbotryum intermedium]